MYRRDKQARLLTGGLIGASSGTTGRRGVGSVASGSPPITNSAYFDATSDYMTFTPASNGDQRKWTLSFWAKKATQDARVFVWGAGTSLSELSYIQLGQNSDGNAFNFLWRDGSTTSRNLQTTTDFPTGVWTHVVMAFDAANATTADRIKVYIDGSLITSFSSDSRSTLSGSSSPPMNAADRHAIGVYAYNLAKPGTSSAFDLADLHFIDGQVLSAADFGEDVSGTWSAKEYTGTYGSNGYHLDFTDGNNLGADNSGNGNNWTEVSLTAANNSDAVTTSDIPQVIPETTATLRTRGYIGAAPAGSGGMLTLYDRLLNRTASGGLTTDITVGGQNYRVHTFNSSGTFTAHAPLTDVEYLVIGGGGGGRSGGGGAGGYRSSVSGENSGGGASAETPLALSPGAYSITVGAGGSQANGGDSTAFGITAVGGGVGGQKSVDNAGTGGSGGGAGNDLNTVTREPGTTGQGYNGGRSNTNFFGAAGGGGGAGAAGSDATTQSSSIGRGGDGGDGVASSITGTAVFYAGGGGGGCNTDSSAATDGGTGGLGGGGDGARTANGTGNDGTANLGGGGGGSDDEFQDQGGDGGSGVVIIRYKI